MPVGLHVDSENLLLAINTGANITRARYPDKMHCFHFPFSLTNIHKIIVVNAWRLYQSDIVGQD